MFVCVSGDPVLSSKTSSCSPRWIVYNNMHAYGADLFSSESTQLQCLDACVANSNCVAVDWARSKSECWMHDRHRQRGPYGCVTHFEIVRECHITSSTWHNHFGCLGGAAVRRRTRDRKVAGSIPGRGVIKSTRSTQHFIPPLHIRFRLAPRSMTLDDIELL